MEAAADVQRYWAQRWSQGITDEAEEESMSLGRPTGPKDLFSLNIILKAAMRPRLADSLYGAQLQKSVHLPACLGEWGRGSGHAEPTLRLPSRPENF